MTTPTLEELHRALEELKAMAEIARGECAYDPTDQDAAETLQMHVSQIAMTAEALALRIHKAEASPPLPPDDQDDSGRRRQSTEESIRLAFSSV